MKSKSIIIISILFCTSVLTLNIIILVNTFSLKKQITLFQEATTKQINDFEENQNNKLTELQDQITKQFNKTVYMSKTYDKILETEKKDKVEQSELDNEMIKTKSTIKQLYHAKKYREAYNLCLDVLSYNKNDIDARLYKMYSLFNINKMDSSKYSEILNDYDALTVLGYKDKTMDDIYNFINSEVSE